MNPLPLLSLLFSVLLLSSPALFGSAPARAAGTEPPLAIVKAEAARGESHGWLRLEGTFPSGDLIQQAYPIEVVVREIGDDDGFLWFRPPHETLSGQSTFTALGAAWLETLAVEGGEDPNSRVLHFGPRSIELQLGPDFSASEGEAVFVVVYEDEPVFSNPMRFVVEETKP
ncbi:MAG: hypothetical protein AAGC67_07595 [Myxococcota bacterium]